jgi:protease IV
MNKRGFNLVSAILKGTWAIDPLYALQHLPWAEDFINGKKSSFFDDDDDEEPEPIATVYVQDGGLWRKATEKDPLSLQGIQTFSIAGPMMKQGSCGSYGTADYAEAMMEAYANRRVAATLVNWDTPGGQVYGTPTLHDAVKNPAKPTVSLINDGMCCSAGVWASIGSDAILASQATDIFGSIGVYTTLRDARKMYEEYGIKLTEIYSSRSTEKNIEYRRALEGDLAPMRSSLDKTADVFIETVAASRKGKLTADRWKKGGTFTAKEAKDEGLIDGMSSFQDALSLAADMANTRKQKSFSNPNNNPNMSLLQNAKNFILGTGASAEGDENTRREAAMTALAGVAEEAQKQAAALQEQVTGLTKERDTAKGELVAANTKITGLENQITTLTKERDDAVAKAEEFGKQPGDKPTPKGTSAGSEGGDDDKTDWQKVINELPHNKAAAEVNNL